jgi:two-component system phosphate regulon sensor histidine kinase PhoR
MGRIITWGMGMPRGMDDTVMNGMMPDKGQEGGDGGHPGDMDLKAVLDRVSAGIMALDGTGRVTLVNEAMGRILGLVRDAVVGREIDETPLPARVRVMAKEALGGREVEEELELSNPPGTMVHLKAAPLGVEMGGGNPAVVILEDITARRRVEMIRRDFVANISHELRTPVANVTALVDALSHGAIGEPELVERFLKDLERETRRLSQLVEDLLILSRLESEEIAPQMEEVRIKQVVEEVLSDKEKLARRYEVNLRRGPTEGILLRADRRFLTVALSNLVDNAVKYNRQGGLVTVEACRRGGEVRISVTDTGIGIPRDQLSRVFERFYRVDKARSRESGGTGLGLSIVKHVMELHGGRVEVESEPGAGSTFTLVFRASSL